MASSRNNIIIRNESDDEAVYYVRSEPPILEGGVATSVVWFKTPRISCGSQCLLHVNSNLEFYAFFGHITAPLTQHSRVNLTTFHPVHVGSVANDGDSFLFSKSLKLTRMDGDAPHSTFSIVTDTGVPTRHGNYVYVLGLARAVLNSTKASVPPMPVAALAVQPEVVYTFTPRSGVLIGREEIETARAGASPPARLNFEGFDEQAVVIDRGAGLFLAGSVEDGAGSGAVEVVDGPSAPVPLQQPVPEFSTMKSALLTVAPLTESREKDERGQGSNTFQAVGAADSDTWLARLQLWVAHWRPGSVSPERRLRVAILDSGIDLTHEDFLNEGRIKNKKSFLKGCSVQDTDGHGTHLAGLILSLTQNVDLYIAKVTDSAEKIDDHKREIEAALKWARVGDDLLPETGWKVEMISLSLGLDKRDQGIHNQINLCYKADITVFAATSNDGGNGPRMYPSSYDPPVLGIHAATADGELWPKSPNPEKTDNFLTVGQSVRSAKLGGGHTYESGTSVATVVAVAIAALMLGYIEKNIPTPVGGWSTLPRTPSGIRKIFRLMNDGGGRNKNYQWVNPIFFFEKFQHQPTKMNEDIVAELNNLGR